MTLSLCCRIPMGLLAIMAVVSCTSHVAADTQSVQSGHWSDPATWSTGQPPDASDSVTISAGDKVIYGLSSGRVAGVSVEDGATLSFHPDMHATLETDENVLVLGRLEMRPRAPDNGGWRNSVGDWRPYVIHTLRFINVDERAFVGGGMDPLTSDVGLWVMGDGVLDIAGAQKTGWTRLARAASAGDTSIRLEAAPTGWRVGDVISIVPTERPDAGSVSYRGFDVRTIGAVDGARVVLSNPLDHDHPEVADPFTGNVYTAEVLNLSRNVRVEGTGNGSASFQPSDNGRAHILIRSTSPQSVRYAEFVLLGPRGTHDRDPTDGVLGRYPLHFHHNGDNSRGSLVEGVVVRQSGNRAFVPHASHGITFRDTIAYDSRESAYWWDFGGENQSHDILYDHTIAALLKDDPGFRGYDLVGYMLGEGRGNEVRDSVAVGIQGKGAGFHWPSKANHAQSNVWIFSEGNVSHNNKKAGLFVWQNDENCHVVENFAAFRNGGDGIVHGAYVNDYIYRDISLFENHGAAIRQHSLPVVLNQSNCESSDGYANAYRDVRADGALIFADHSLPAGRPILLKDCVINGVILDGANGRHPTVADFVGCTRPKGADLEPTDFDLLNPKADMMIRAQRTDGTAFQITGTGQVTMIPAFYETGDEDNDAGDAERLPRDRFHEHRAGTSSTLMEAPPTRTPASARASSQK